MFFRVIGVRRPMRVLSVFLVAGVALILGAAAPEIWADDAGEFDETKIIIETNDTAKDAGIQIFLDGEAWKEVKVKGPDGKQILEVKGKGSLKELGLTELFMESDEPEFDEAPEELLALFPEGEYEFQGKTVDDIELEGTATLTYDIPDGPSIVSPSGDDPVNPGNTVIDWEPVTTPSGIEIVRYQVIVENEAVDPVRVFSVDLPAMVTEVQVSPQFLEPGTQYKFEVLAIEASGNQTITESFFKTE
jgi:hypothetical protein